jgi:hypothetical protein
MAYNGADHLNAIERKLIDVLTTGTYDTTSGPEQAWATNQITVYGQFPTTTETNYPCIIVEMTANGVEEQFMGQNLTFGAGATAAKGELYGVGFNIHILIDNKSSIEIGPGGSTEFYKGRRLLNYIMLNCANILMDCNFSSTTTEVVERHYSGFRDMGYNPELEIWASLCSMVIVFKNNR